MGLLASLKRPNRSSISFVICSIARSIHQEGGGFIGLKLFLVMYSGSFSKGVSPGY